jgi:hypothetical protein
MPSSVGDIGPRSNFYDTLGKNVRGDMMRQARAAGNQLTEAKNQLKKNMNQAILSSTFSTSLPSMPAINIPGRNMGSSPVQAPSPATTAEPESVPPPVAKGNSAVNTQSTAITVSGGKGNNVQGSTGWASSGNTVSVNGSANTVNIAGKNTYAVSDFTFNATGGPEIRNNNVSVSGSDNSVQFSGQRISGNQINISGASNSVDLGSGVTDATLAINADSVSVSIGNNDVLAKSNSGWKIDVSVDNISVSIKDGKAEVTGSGASSAEISIDYETKSITVGAAAV